MRVRLIPTRSPHLQLVLEHCQLLIPLRKHGTLHHERLDMLFNQALVACVFLCSLCEKVVTEVCEAATIEEIFVEV